MFRRGSIQLARISGIRVGADLSWFVLLFIFIFVFSDQFRLLLNGSDLTAYMTAVACALLLFGSVLLHELGHALVARRLGAQVEGIQLILFGGLTLRRGDSQSPGEEFKVAAAGPAVTLIITLLAVALGLALAGPRRFGDAASLSGGTISPVLLVLSFLGTMNLFVLVLNLVPALPLDGGRLLRALLWWQTGSKNRATRISGQLGQWFGWALGGVGLFLLFGGSTSVGLWALLIGFLVGQSARAAVVSATVAERLEGLTISQIMDSQPVAVPAQTTALAAEDEFFVRFREPWLPVTDAGEHLLGRISRQRVQEAVAEGTPALPVVELLADGEPTALRVGEEMPLGTLLSSEALGRLGALCAVDSEDRLVGMVTLDHVRRALQAASMH